MRGVKCADCDEYRNEWCEKVIDSPCPDIFRDCQYWHKRKDMVEVIRCRDCKKNPHWEWVGCPMTGKGTRKPDDFCSYAERREDG